MITELTRTEPPLPPPPPPDVPEHGLSTEEARRKLVEVGANELRRDEGTPPWRFFLGQFTSPVVWLLLGAAAISGVMREAADAIALSKLARARAGGRR